MQATWMTDPHGALVSSLLHHDGAFNEQEHRACTLQPYRICWCGTVTGQRVCELKYYNLDKQRI